MVTELCPMKIEYIALAAFGMATWPLPLCGRTVPSLDLPQEVVRLTTPEKLPALVSAPSSPSFGEMKGVIANTKNGFAFQIGTGIGEDCVIVVNGKLLQTVRNGKELGVHIMEARGGTTSMPIPFWWFAKYGDPLVIGLFPIGKGGTVKVTRGFLYAVRFSDLIDDKGNLRYFKIWARSYEMKPLSRLQIVCQKPDFGDIKNSPLVKMRSSAPVVTEGEMVVMKPYVVEAVKDWMTFTMMRIDEKSAALLVDGVKEGKPYALAGLKPGMFITRLKVLDSDGSPSEGSDWTKGDIILEVKDSMDGSPRPLVVSAESLRKAIPAKKADVLATRE